jgi:hypothetical protein
MKDNPNKETGHETKFHDLSDEEYNRLDEKWTETTPKVGPNGSGFFSRRKASARTVTIDDFTADYLMIKAMATQKTPAEIINEMVQERIAASL